MRWFTVLGVLLASVLPLAADFRDETVKQLFDRSQLVIVGKIMSDPVVTQTGEQQLVRYTFEFKVTQTLRNVAFNYKGTPPDPAKKPSITVQVSRVEQQVTDRLSFLKKGGECILFMQYKVVEKKLSEFGSQVSIDFDDTTDRWLGIQSYSLSLVKHLDTLKKTRDR
jgi:hypothetical protein